MVFSWGQKVWRIPITTWCLIIRFADNLGIAAVLRFCHFWNYLRLLFCRFLAKWSLKMALIKKNKPVECLIYRLLYERIWGRFLQFLDEICFRLRLVGGHWRIKLSLWLRTDRFTSTLLNLKLIQWQHQFWFGLRSFIFNFLNVQILFYLNLFMLCVLNRLKCLQFYLWTQLLLDWQRFLVVFYCLKIRQSWRLIWFTLYIFVWINLIFM